MKNIKLKILYEDNNILVVDKPAGITVFPEGNIKEKTLIDFLIEKYPEIKEAGKTPRYGIIHRLDKDTSGLILVAKTAESLIFFQKQFKNRSIEKKYLALATGKIKENQDRIETLIGRAPKNKLKQKVYLPLEPSAGNTGNKREAVTEYKVLEQFEDYTLLEAVSKTGRKHQIRCHLAYIGHPIAGDKIYGFKNQSCPKGLLRQFLHASYLRVKLANNQIKEFKSELPEDLRKVMNNLNPNDKI